MPPKNEGEVTSRQFGFWSKIMATLVGAACLCAASSLATQLATNATFTEKLTQNEAFHTDAGERLDTLEGSLLPLQLAEAKTNLVALTKQTSALDEKVETQGKAIVRIETNQVAMKDDTNELKDMVRELLRLQRGSRTSGGIN